jgi:cytochrome P450
VNSRPVVEFDHHSAEYAKRGDEINRDLVERCPVAWSTAYGGFWVVSGHSALREVARDDATYSSDHDTTGDGNGTGGITIPPVPFRTVPIEMDPPEFHDYRRLLNPYFSPKAAERWQPFMDAAADHCLDVISERGSGDIILDLANPMPAMFTLAFMGLPVEDWKIYAEPAHRMVYTPEDSPDRGEAVMGCLTLINDLYAQVVRRRSEPTDDFIAYLMSAKVNGELLDDQRINEMLFLLIFGGVDTTTGLTANALVWLAQHPEQRARLIAQPGLMETAIEEFLRYFAPVQTLGRTVMKDTQLAGFCPAAGDRLLMNFAAANRDPAEFADPDQLLIDRTPNRHAAFGLGIHRCLGSNFARAMIAAMVGGVLRRMPDYTVDIERAARYETIGTVKGWSAVPITFTPTPATGTPMPEPLPFVRREESGA